MRERQEGEERPGAYVDDYVSRGQFWLVPVFFQTAQLSSDGSSQGGGGMTLHDAVELNQKQGSITDIKNRCLVYGLRGGC